jgi:putative phage-type endonuclease
MPITEEQLSRRRDYLGASDLPAILRLSPWRTPYEVWAEKTGRIESNRDSGAIRAGTALESAVLEMAARELGPILPGGEFSIPGTPIVVHPDGMTEASEPVEAKTTGITGPVHGTWGDAGTDKVPDYYLVQCLAQLEATKAGTCYLPALIGTVGLRIYRIEASREIQARIVELALDWWERHVVRDTPPEDTAPPLEIVKRLRREPGRVVAFDSAELVDAWQDAKDALAAAQKAKDELESKLLAALGDAEAASLPDGRRVTFLEQKRKAYTVPESTFRVLRVVKPRKGASHG